jgi:hypothetical protein
MCGGRGYHDIATRRVFQRCEPGIDVQLLADASRGRSRLAIVPSPNFQRLDVPHIGNGGSVPKRLRPCSDNSEIDFRTGRQGIDRHCARSGSSHVGNQTLVA